MPGSEGKTGAQGCAHTHHSSVTRCSYFPTLLWSLVNRERGLHGPAPSRRRRGEQAHRAVAVAARSFLMHAALTCQFPLFLFHL